MRAGGVLCPTVGCGKRLGSELLGLYATTCPKCKQVVRWVTYGERRIEDEFSVTVISVTRVEKDRPAT